MTWPETDGCVYRGALEATNRGETESFATATGFPMMRCVVLPMRQLLSTMQGFDGLLDNRRVPHMFEVCALEVPDGHALGITPFDHQDETSWARPQAPRRVRK